MADPLFTNCKVEFVPVVDFKFVDVCQIPDLPPPIFDCASPSCPPLEPPPPCPTIDGGPVTVNVIAVPPDCECPTPPGGTFNVTSNDKCEFNLSLALDIPVPAPPCPDFTPGKTTVKANYGSCEPSTGQVTVTPQPRLAPCEDGTCKFDLGLDLALSIPPPPCPKITVSGTADSKASKLTGTGKSTPGTCGTPECEITIEITHPPIPTPVETTVLINEFFNTNVNTFIETYITDNSIDIVTNLGPTFNTYINTGGGGDNRVCIPKYEGGKINVTTGASMGGSITVTGNNDATDNCTYKVCVAEGNELQWGADISDRITAQLIARHPNCPVIITAVQGGPTVYTAVLDQCWCAALGGVVETQCEEIDANDAAAVTACTNKEGGQVGDGPCGGKKKCEDYKITADITVEETCVPTYHGGDITVEFSEDDSDKPKGEIKIQESTCNSCYYPAGSDGARYIAVFGDQSGGFMSPSGKPCTEKGNGAFCCEGCDDCASIGGSERKGKNCTANCDDKDITATLTLPKALGKLKFTEGEGSLTPSGPCDDSAEPFVKVKVAIEKDGAAEGEYKIKVSGSFCTCCGGTAAEPEAPG